MNNSDIGSSNIEVKNGKGFQVGNNNRQTNIFYGDDPEEEKVAENLDKNSPYLGLASFTELNSTSFYGRKDLIGKLLEYLENNNLILLLGASGSGKSSLVKAGIIPKFSQKNKPFAELSFFPGDAPFDAFFDELKISPPKRLNLYNKKEIKTIVESIDNPKANLGSIIKKLRQDKNDFWIIFIDQFEELFSQTPENERILFLDSLNSLINLQSEGQDNSLKIILAMRTDFLERLSPFPEFQETIEKHICFVKEMTDRELKLVIKNPAATHGVNVDRDLIEEIINDFRGESRSLPLLQYTLDLLWKKDDLSDRLLNQKTYEGLGRVGGALQQQAETIYQQFEEQEQGKAVEKIFRQLVTITWDGKRVSKRQKKSIFISQGLEEIVEQLIQEHRLLISGRQKDRDSVEIAHEALINSWSRLQDWITKYEAEIILERQLNDSAQTWQKVKEDENKAIGELWRDSKLGQILELLKSEFPPILDEVAKEFIKASVELRDRQKRAEELKRANDLARDSLSLFDREKELESFVKVIKAGKILQKHKATDPEVMSAFIANIYEGSERNRLQGHSDRITCVSFSPDGQLLASGSFDQTIKLWNLETGEEPRTLKGHSKNVRSVSFSPDGTTLASGSDDQTIKLWNLETGEAIRTLEGHYDPAITYVSFSPDGQILASGSDDQTIKLWNLETGEAICTLQGHTKDIWSVSFNPDGQILASGSSDQTIKLWNLDLNLDSLMERSCDLIGNYLQHNAKEEDRHLCDGIGPQK